MGDNSDSAALRHSTEARCHSTTYHILSLYFYSFLFVFTPCIKVLVRSFGFLILLNTVDLHCEETPGEDERPLGQPDTLQRLEDLAGPRGPRSSPVERLCHSNLASPSTPSLSGFIGFSTAGLSQSISLHISGSPCHSTYAALNSHSVLGLKFHFWRREGPMFLFSHLFLLGSFVPPNLLIGHSHACVLSVLGSRAKSWCFFHQHLYAFL